MTKEQSLALTPDGEFLSLGFEPVTLLIQVRPLGLALLLKLCHPKAL